MSASFPYLRMRRGRSSPWMRAMLAENRLHPSDFIWPLFICEGRDCEEPIGSLPGVSRWSVDRLAAKAQRSRGARHPVHRPVPQHARRAAHRATRAKRSTRDNLICRAIKAIKDAVPEIGVLTDVALDPYTAHGHDGLDRRGRQRHQRRHGRRSSSTRRWSRPRPGADIVAPSDMMDGRVAAIREALEDARAPECRDHGLCRQICVGLLRPVPRGGRLARAA